MAAQSTRGGATGVQGAGAGKPPPRPDQPHCFRLEENVEAGYRSEHDKVLQSMLKQSREAIKRSRTLLLLRIEPLLARVHQGTRRE